MIFFYNRHIFFWPREKKWNFVLTCAGVDQTPNNDSTLNIVKLHEWIKRSAKKDDIKGSWVSVLKAILRNKVPVQQDDDTPTGLLRFIKFCSDSKSFLKNEETDLCDCILDAFPALPLSLYRMLDSTSWLQHPSFRHFSEI